MAIPTAEARARVRILDWATEIESSSAYSDSLVRIRALYDAGNTGDSGGFRAAVNAATAQVVGRVSNPMPINVELGSECLLQELAFLEALGPILRGSTQDEPSVSTTTEKFVFCYHKPWPVFCKYIEEHAELTSPETTGFLCVKDLNSRLR